LLGDDNLTWNEKDVTAERLLHRPQNKKSFESYGYNVQDYCNLPFKDFLDHCKLSEGLQSIIIYSLALQTDAAVSTESALSSLYLHMNSLGRYGPTAFLYPHYGLSELNQAFARMSAVWGCTHMLRTGVRRLVVSPGTEKDHRVKVISHDYQEFSCRHFICEVSSWKGLASTQSVLQRVSLFKGCILPVTDEGSSFIVISPQCPGVGNEYGIYVVQHGASSCTTTGDYYKLHMSTRCPSEGVSDFDLAELMERAIEYLMSKSLHKGTDVIELAHLTTITPVLDTASITLPESVYVISHYDEDLHYERAVFEARRVFAQVCEDKNFFEKLPTEHATEELNEMDELDSALDNIGAYANRSHLGGNDSDEVTVSIINA
jgi:RAB protein geranylgeranyltransferase component A